MEPVRNSHTRIALYRKYRPKKLEDLLGQETNVQILKNAAAAGRLGHAYLFYGSRGTGKTSTARLIAKLLNCERRRDDAEFRKLGEPCNECRHCAEIDAQSSFDVIVLATTEYENLPATITSRTQRFVFKKLPKTKIMEKLAHIARTEKIEIDEPALELIAAAAEGSLRDAESLLDQISAMHPPSHEASARQGSKIGLADVARITGRVGLKRVHELTALIIQRDLKGCLAYLGELGEDGQNMVQFTKDLIHYFRKILSLKMSPALEKVFAGELTADEIEGVRKLGAALDQAVAVKLIKSFIRAYSEMRYSPFAVVPLEIALVENLSQQKGPAE